MQILKDDIRNDINVAALDLFCEKGFSKVSMRMIARKSYVSVGNIYRYYENKNDLFDSLIEDTYNKLLAVFDFSAWNTNSSDELIQEAIDNVVKNFIALYNEDKKRVRILLYGSEGSDRGSTVDTIGEIVKSELHKIILNRSKVDIDAEYLSEMLTSSLLDNAMKVLENFESDEERIAHINELIKLYVSNYLH